MQSRDEERANDVISNLRLTEKAMETYKAAFKLFDTDGDGAMTLDELTKVMRSLGRDLDQSELREMLQEFDVNCDEEIEFPEFLAAIGKFVNNVESEEELMEIFRTIDQDGDGNISLSDLRKVSLLIGMKLTNDDMNDMFHMADHDSNGNVNFEEFRRMVQARE